VLRSNLSTRPFYNERLASLVILLAVLVAVALTAFNVTKIIALTGQRSVYASEIERDQNEAARIRSAATALQKSIDQQQMKTLVVQTREANGLIDARTFSWTSFFEQVEKTLPLDARIIGVTPRVEKQQIIIAIAVVSKRLEDLQAFTEALQATGVFYDIGVASQQLNEDGTFAARVEGGYLPARPAGVPAKTPVGKGRP
jgi:hypothetical protein